MYCAAANGFVETFNKTLCNLLKKIMDKSKKIGIFELKKLFGRIELLFELLRKQSHMYLSTVLKLFFYLSVKYLH